MQTAAVDLIPNESRATAYVVFSVLSKHNVILYYCVPVWFRVEWQ